MCTKVTFRWKRKRLCEKEHKKGQSIAGILGRFLLIAVAVRRNLLWWMMASTLSQRSPTINNPISTATSMALGILVQRLKIVVEFRSAQQLRLRFRVIIIRLLVSAFRRRVDVCFARVCRSYARTRLQHIIRNRILGAYLAGIQLKPLDKSAWQRATQRYCRDLIGFRTERSSIMRCVGWTWPVLAGFLDNWIDTHTHTDHMRNMFAPTITLFD